MKEDDVLGFAKALVNAKRDLAYCSVCGHITDRDPCYICNDSSRSISCLCRARTERCNRDGKMKEYQGVYHVLRGAISPMEVDRKTLISRNS